MTEQIELHQLHISALRPRSWPLPWPTPTELTRARETGLIEPVTVRPLKLTSCPVDYEILAGLKHWLLAQRLALSTIPAQVCEVDDETARLWVEAEIVPTLWNPIAEARVLQQRVRAGLSVAAAGREFGLTRTDASHRLRLLRLAPDVQEQIVRGELAAGTARALVGLNPSQQRNLAVRIRCERLSCRKVEALAKNFKIKKNLGNLSADNPVLFISEDPDQSRLESELTDILGTPVTLKYNPDGTGSMIIFFSNLDIFDNVLGRLGYQ
jgi:ParB family chromosome partitioning protein